MTAIVVECQFDQVQDILLGITGARTVPRVFVDGKCIGGGTKGCQLMAVGMEEMNKHGTFIWVCLKTGNTPKPNG